MYLVTHGSVVIVDVLRDGCPIPGLDTFLDEFSVLVLIGLVAVGSVEQVLASGHVAILVVGGVDDVAPLYLAILREVDHLAFAVSGIHDVLHLAFHVLQEVVVV